MRVHGEEKIVRSNNVPYQNNYQKYTPYLREDFKHICGYCGKHEIITKKGFEPDHFVPVSMDSTREKDYTNLVYSCFTCNRKKLGKWPTRDKCKCHNNSEGFIDPATEEYDLHVKRNEDGTIVGVTAVGQYMCEKVFKFKLRPMGEIFRIMELIKAKERLYQIREKLTIEEYKQYVELDRNINELQMILFEKKE